MSSGLFPFLEHRIEKDLATIERLYEALGEPELRDDEPQETLIVVGYRLHQLYNAFEDIFRNVAASFEDALEEDEWGGALLRQMRLDLSPLRTAVIDDQAFDALDELRRCRQVYLSVYAASLYAQRLALAVQKALVLRTIYAQQLGRFLQFLRSLR